jgi:DNA polymerase I-like protein with 3'-5' exonuclease and polymerase domains
VQGFATADLLPIALVELDKVMRKAKMQSVICNTVHDSIVLDVHPTEKDQCIKVLSDAMLSISDGSKARYSIEYDMPIGIELKIGENWLDLSEVNY